MREDARSMTVLIVNGLISIVPTYYEPWEHTEGIPVPGSVLGYMKSAKLVNCAWVLVFAAYTEI
jgi:hypothetical protein